MEESGIKRKKQIKSSSLRSIDSKTSAVYEIPVFKVPEPLRNLRYNP